ncbi:SpoIIE family protein phosphatase [Actinomadura barringtoniae]|uniref:SpoIIE family protein phosphatase n=1 Tax=Actinomadura barringtoniae TaxID=1427535 RepID=A0A939PK25_9ACTN|nr:SpoIIE family protein phosphatase [Actinomadura barringtoniae]MBO2451289.1 SpoIIE family protein phosphatase [Actinomadura barringtoniae]
MPDPFGMGPDAFDPARYLVTEEPPGLAPAWAEEPALDLHDHEGPFAEPDPLDVAAELAVCSTADDLARLLHTLLYPFGAGAVVLAVIEEDGSMRMSGVAGTEGEAVKEWSRVPLQYALPLVRIPVADRSWWLGGEGEPGHDAGEPGELSEPGPQTLAWFGSAAPEAEPDTRLVAVVSAVWSKADPPCDARARTYLEDLVTDAGRRLRALSSRRLQSGDLRAPWIDAVLAAIPIPAALLYPIRDRSGRVLEFTIDRCNELATDLRGRTPDEITGTRLLHTFPGLEASGIFDAYLEVLETGEALQRDPMPYEEPLGDEIHPAVLSVRAQRIGDGLLVSWQFHDEQARLAGRLADTERLAHLGWAEWDLVKDEVYWSPRVYEMFEIDPREGPLRLETLPSAVQPEDLPAVAEAFTVLREERRPATFEFRTFGGEHECRLRVHAEPVLDARGRLVALRGAVQDVTSAAAGLVAEGWEAPEPQVPYDLPGLRIAAHLRATGGEWCEATVLPGGRVLLGAGDASDDRPQSALRLRDALVGIAFTGADPAGVLGCLNLVAFHGEGPKATAVIARFDPEERTLAWARAGNPQPILVRGGTARELRVAEGPLLGAGLDARFGTTATRLLPGDRIVFRTRGPLGGDLALPVVAAACRGEEPAEDVVALLESAGQDVGEAPGCLMVAHVTEGDDDL